MPWAYCPSGALRGGSQGCAGAWRDRANALLDQGPRGFDGIEVVRVRWQEADRGARLAELRGEEQVRIGSRAINSRTIRTALSIALIAVGLTVIPGWRARGAAR